MRRPPTVASSFPAGETAHEPSPLSNPDERFPEILADARHDPAGLIFRLQNARLRWRALDERTEFWCKTVSPFAPRHRLAALGGITVVRNTVGACTTAHSIGANAKLGPIISANGSSAAGANPWANFQV